MTSLSDPTDVSVYVERTARIMLGMRGSDLLDFEPAFCQQGGAGKDST